MNKKIIAVTGALLALGATSALAETAKPAKPKPDCFWSQNVTNFAADNEDNVYLRVGQKDVYRLEMFGPCRDVDFNTAIAIVPRSGSSNICTGMDADLVSRTSIGPQRCAVRHITKLTAAEVAALPKRARP